MPCSCVRYLQNEVAINLWMLHFQLFDFMLVHAELLSTPTQQVKSHAQISQQNFHWTSQDLSI